MGRGRGHNTIRCDINPQDYRIERCQRKVVCFGSNSTIEVSSSIKSVLSSAGLDSYTPQKKKRDKEKNNPVVNNNIPEIVIQNGDE